MAEIKIKLIYWNCRMRITKARLAFWKMVLAYSGSATPERSEELTGIEVTERDE
jgi:hypothetical protein